MENSTHFVTRIVVERVDHVVKVAINEGRANQILDKPQRIVTELLSVSVKANDITALIDKTDAHMHLVEDIAATDPKATGGPVRVNGPIRG